MSSGGEGCGGSSCSSIILWVASHINIISTTTNTSMDTASALEK